jgi:hypothetical protein
MADTFTKDEQQAFARMAAATQDKPQPEQQLEETPPAEGQAEATTDDNAEPQEEYQSRLVPHAALRDERDQHKQTRVELQKLRDERNLFEGRLQAILAMRQEEQQRSQPQPEPEPTAMTDPIGTITRLQEQVEGLYAGNQQQSEMQREQSRQMRLYNAALSDANRFKQQTPDYNDAYSYFRQHRANELAAYGYDAAQTQQVINSEEMQIANQAFQRGVSPAETLYQVARLRGYQGSGQNGADNGNQPARQIDRINQGQTRSRTLSGTGGGAVSTSMTAEQLGKMTQSEFEDWLNRQKDPDRAFKRLMGG